MTSTNYTNNSSKSNKVFGLIGAVLALIVPILIMFHDPHVESSQSLCPFKMVTGFPCPGCGLTKSIIFFYQGDIVKSLGYHIFGPAVVAFCLVAAITLAVELFTKKTYFRKYLYNRSIGYSVAIVLFAYHFIRLGLLLYNHSISEIFKDSIWV